MANEKVVEQLVKTGQVVFENETTKTTFHVEYDENEEMYKYNEFNFHDATLEEFISLCENDEIEQHLKDGGEYSASENTIDNAVLALDFILS